MAAYEQMMEQWRSRDKAAVREARRFGELGLDGQEEILPTHWVVTPAVCARPTEWAEHQTLRKPRRRDRAGVGDQGERARPLGSLATER